jgi:hypothetical protein
MAHNDFLEVIKEEVWWSLFNGEDVMGKYLKLTYNYFPFFQKMIVRKFSRKVENCTKIFSGFMMIQLMPAVL